MHTRRPSIGPTGQVRGACTSACSVVARKPSAARLSAEDTVASAIATWMRLRTGSMMRHALGLPLRAAEGGGASRPVVAGRLRGSKDCSFGLGEVDSFGIGVSIRNATHHLRP